MKYIKNIFICSLLLPVFDASTASEVCKIIEDVPDHYITEDEIELDDWVKGYEIEICENRSEVIISRVGPISHYENTLYFIAEHLCYLAYGATREEILSALPESDVKKVALDCELGDRHTKMCSKEISSCDGSASHEFISVSNINADQMKLVLRKVVAMQQSSDINLISRSLNLDQGSLRKLEKFIGLKDDLQVTVIKFYDYSSFIYPGLIYVTGHKGDMSFVLTYRFRKGDLVLESFAEPDL